MLRRLAGWWERQREAGALHGIIAGLVLAAIGILFLAPWDRTPQKKTLSKKAQARLTQRAEDLAPGVIQFAQELRTRTRELEDDPSEHLDRYIAWVVEWSDSFSAAVEAEVLVIVAQEKVDRAEVRKFLHVQLQERTGRCVPSLSSSGAPQIGRLLCAPRLRIGPPATVEESIEETIQKLLALLPTVSAQGQEGLKKAILRLRKAIVPFDTKPIDIEFTAPAVGIVANYIPEISFSMADTGSGPNPASRNLVALNMGPAVTNSTDLTGYTTVVPNDQVGGTVNIKAESIPDAALQDGFLTLQASGTDYAGNAVSTATREFVLDRLGPGIAVVVPANGSTVTDPAAVLSAAISDSVSGIALGSVQVTLNGVDVTTLVVSTPGNLNSLGAPNTLTVTGVLPAVPGANTLVLFAKDVAGNASIATSSFAFVPSVTEEEIQIAIDGGDGQEGTSGRCVASPLVVRATTLGGIPIGGLSIQFRITQGTGELVGPSGLTDSSGRSSVRYQLGRAPGSEKVRAFFANLPEGPSVEFSLESHPAILQLSNFVSTEVSEFPGSALPFSFFVNAKRADGSFLSGEEVVPELLDANGVPLSDPGAIGQFHPRVGTTAVDGSVRFAFEISPGAFQALAGETGGGFGALPFQVRFRLNDFVDSQGNPIRTAAQPAAVQNPENKPLGILDSKGQGQILLPGKTTPLKLEAFTNEMGFGGTSNPLTFTIVEGGGSLLEGGGVGDGTFTPTAIDPNGNVVQAFVQPAEGSNIARIRYKRGTSPSPSLIALNGSGGIFFDVFVVGVPNAFWVDGNGNPTFRAHAADLSAPTAVDKLRLRYLTQADESSSVGLTLKAKSPCLTDISPEGGTIGGVPVVLNMMASQKVSDAPSRYRIFESPEVVVTSELLETGVASGNGFFAIHSFGGGALQLELQAGTIQITLPQLWVQGVFVGGEFTTDTTSIGVVTASVSGVIFKQGRTLKFFANGQEIGSAVTNAMGVAKLEHDFVVDLSLLRVQDTVSHGVSPTMAVSGWIQPAHAHVSPGGAEFIPPDPLLQDNSGAITDVLKKSASGKTLLEDADIKDKFTLVPWPGAIDGDPAIAGKTSWDKFSGKYLVQVKKSGDPVRGAIVFKHELTHVKEKVATKKLFETMIKETKGFKEGEKEIADARTVLTYAAWVYAWKKYVDPGEEAGKTNAVTMFLDQEFAAYEAGWKTKLELKDAGETTDWYKEFEGKTEAQRKDIVKDAVKPLALKWRSDNKDKFTNMKEKLYAVKGMEAHLKEVTDKQGDKLLKYFTDQDIFPEAK